MFMVYQLILCLLRGLALGEFLYNFDKVALEVLGSAGWGCTLPGRVFVEYGLYSVLCATGQRRTYILRLKTDPHFWHLAILRLLIVLVKATGMQAITCPLHLFHAAAVAILPQRWRHHQTRNG